ncbi:hypothetical protein [Shewanella sp.]|uniref:hypothetical protein n=1 Tax=Shewanella sp. TaxID=50422 RepID=UPI003A8BD919
MHWQAVQSKGNRYDLSHIHPHEFRYQRNDLAITVRVTYGFHVFTDEKADGDLIRYKYEERYFCIDRYDASFQLRQLIETKMTDAYVVLFLANKHKEQFYYLDIHDYTVFFELRKADQHTLKCHVVSAYIKDRWGNLPRGKRYKWDFIAHAKMNELKIK